MRKNIFFFKHALLAFHFFILFWIFFFACRNFSAERRWRHRSLSWYLRCPNSSWSWTPWTRTEWTLTDLGTVRWLTHKHISVVWHLFACRLAIVIVLSLSVQLCVVRRGSHQEARDCLCCCCVLQQQRFLKHLHIVFNLTMKVLKD